MNRRKTLDLVEYIPQFCNKEEIDALMLDCESLSLPDSRKTSSQWLSTKNVPYIYADVDPVHHAKDISKFPAIANVLNKINSDSRFPLGDLDSCLVLKYSCASASTSLHADDESSLDQAKPICNISIGSVRTLEFFSFDGKKRVTSYKMESGSMVHMKPGTQQALKHCVRGKSSKSPELRFSLSFRALAKQSSSIQPHIPEPPEVHVFRRFRCDQLPRRNSQTPRTSHR